VSEFELSPNGGFEWSKIMDADSFFKRIVQPDTRPGVWRWDDIVSVMDEMDKHPKRYPAYRRFCALVSEEWEGAPGASPAIFTGLQRIHPGESLPGHRHTSVSIYYWIKGSGKAIVGGHEIRFNAGDFFSCPAWHSHEFINDGDEDMIMIAIHDMTLLAQMRALMWEEPLGQENIQHLVRERATSWSAEETAAGGVETAEIIVSTGGKGVDSEAVSNSEAEDGSPGKGLS
jgi:gentisate 1,2-dioxygenase